jgi:hypothetical protein
MLAANVPLCQDCQLNFQLEKNVLELLVGKLQKRMQVSG